jgi:hypothetical protein
LETIYPKTANGFEKPMKTEVLVIQMSKEHAEAMDHAFARHLPADSQGEFYLSYIQDPDDDITCCIFTQQNQWLQSVKLVTVGRFKNINRKYDGLSKCYLLCEFMHEQLTRDQTVSIDVKNGGSGGKMTVIVHPEHYIHVKLTFTEF